ncbi:MAG TPA: glutamate synthase large subunit [Acidimicrobiales bacterium]|nr:glutamate synthase large subunit [Acidimicrobiales bacterium]
MLHPPGPTGLYDPAYEHDACGVSFVVDMYGRATHDLVSKAVGSLCHLEHRGASGADVDTGDGAGILIQVPDAFYREVVDFDLPTAGTYATGIAFLPADPNAAELARTQIAEIAKTEQLTVLGWRRVPVDPSPLGRAAREAMPALSQLFVAGDAEALSGLALERRAFVLRKRIEHEICDDDGRASVYFPSLSARTIVYKGMLTTPQLDEFYPDLLDERVISAIGLVHSRFSTNTFPSWPLAHPYRYVAHNGEINTVSGNRNWMRAREAMLESDAFGDGELERIFPICTPGASDSATFDEVLELLYLAGRPIHHAVLMMIPAAWENDDTMPEAHRAFYEFHASLMEPWDGPASVAFTDGTVVGAVLDRNGLRPSRYWVTDDGLVVMASEVGVLPIDPAHVVQKGRLRPGRMFLVDTAAGRIIDDDEIKDTLAAEHPYRDWLADSLVTLSDLPDRPHTRWPHASVARRQQTFAYTTEELSLILTPMAVGGAEAIGSMGTDTPVAVLSERPRLLFDYFSQLFAQVTNPPLDAIREQLVTSLRATLGSEGNLLDSGTPAPSQVVLPYPVIDNDELAKLIHIDDEGDRGDLAAVELSTLFEVAGGGNALRRRLDELCVAAADAVRDGARIVVLCDRNSDAESAPIPSLLSTAAVHHHLVRERLRSRAGIIVEAGDAREVHHMAVLVGYGASAINPYLAFETIEDLANRGLLGGVGADKAIANYLKAASKGVLKVMSKMGISTVASYTGAQVFEALGLSQELVDTYFTGTSSKLGGIGLDEIAREVAERHHRAHLERPAERSHRELEGGGEYQWRREGEVHLFNPETVFKLQHGTRTRRYDIFKQYTSAVDDQAGRLATLRGLFSFAEDVREPIPVDEVEPISEIMKRFATGAMSYGSISAEAHQTLAIAMNRIGGKSNTGEGGEDPARLYDPERRSSIKQVASGRFGVTSEYLTNADDIQIKMAQGAKPGEGGQLPGHKVYPWIAEVRHSTPGVGLISPPPHHDIYSIEDLAQLIHDLKNANPGARIHVKLVAEVGVGTVAAGVSKAHSDVVLISGHDGGTGAAPLTSLKHAGGPWELGLAETQQTLLANDLRDRIVVQVDGQLKTGRDVVVAALLGAEEFGFATAPLVVSGCIMMRVCHLNTCPVGIATQDPLLRERFSGAPEFVETFFEYIAIEVRELLAQLGFRSIAEAVGHVESLDVAAAVAHYKSAGLDLTPILAVPELAPGAARRATRGQDHGLDRALDNAFIADSAPALERGEKVTLAYPVSNVNRTVGTMLGHELTKRYRGEGLPDDTIDITLTGSAGQSLGAFLPSGITLRLEGDANDYVGKGLSGGQIIVRPPHDSHPDFVAEDNIIAGNVIAYGATGGEIFLRGIVGERFCVRNSGATAVVEGVGDHACEYMTGGRAVILGPTGRNFAAGMSGGIAYVWDPGSDFERQVNAEMVDLEPLDDLDRTWLISTIFRHSELTGSAVAERLLADWTWAADQFVKVMPRDYKRVLRAIAQAEEDSTDIDEAIMAAAAG